MAVKLRRPILLGGIGLSLALWLLDSIKHSADGLGEWTILGAIATGASLWLFQQATAKKGSLLQAPSPLDRQTVEQAIAEAQSAIALLEAEAENLDATSSNTIAIASTRMRDRVSQLKAELDRQELRLAIVGGKNTGKTTLLQGLHSEWVPQQQIKVNFTETLPLFIGKEKEATATPDAMEVAIASDLVLLIVSGDLTDPEFQTLQKLKDSGTRSVLIWNKIDQCLPEERAAVLQLIQQRIRGTLELEDVIAIAASPSPIKVRQHQPDGSVKEWQEQPAPELTELANRLNQIVLKEGKNLVLASTMRAVKSVKTEVKTVLDRVRRDRAMPLIEQYQWIACAAAFANPVPALDLLATAAINAQLVADLGNLYQQKISLPQAQTAAGTLGKLMLKLGLVELSTQTITSILKSNAITFVAGGAVQGVSAAYLTRIAGLSLIEYFQSQEIAATTEANPLNLDKLGEILKNVFQQNQRIAFLQSFVKKALGQILPESPQTQLVESERVA